MAFHRHLLSPRTYQSGANPSFSLGKGASQRGHHASRNVYFRALDDVRSPSPEVNLYVGDLALHYGGIVDDDGVYHDLDLDGLSNVDMMTTLVLNFPICSSFHSSSRMQVAWSCMIDAISTSRIGFSRPSSTLDDRTLAKAGIKE